MSPEEKVILERTMKLSEENNRILHSIQRSMRIARIMRVVYWLFIIGSAVGAYYLIQPYVDSLVGIYSSISEPFR